jgi:hypothetical protein
MYRSMGMVDIPIPSITLQEAGAPWQCCNWRRRIASCGMWMWIGKKEGPVLTREAIEINTFRRRFGATAKNRGVQAFFAAITDGRVARVPARVSGA